MIVQCFLFFCQIFVNVSLLKGELLLVGDFNYPNINREKLYFSHTPEHCASKFFTATQNSFLHQHVSTTAHSRTNQRSTLIDLIFTSDDQLITNLICGSRLGKGHHKFLEFNYWIKCSLNHGKIHHLYENDLPFINWPQIFDSCKTISCWEKFVNTINPIISKYTLTKKPNSIKKESIWMNKDAISKWKLKNTSCYGFNDLTMYLKPNDQQDYETYA